MNHFARRVELVANVTIVVAAVLMLGVVVERYSFRSRPQPRTGPLRPAVGSKLHLPEMIGSRHPKTLIVALQRGCRFCSESAPFYRRLAASAKGKNIRFIAALPTGVEESTAYLNELGVTDVEVRQLTPERLHTSGTPTLILTDDKGQITAFWLGKLTPEREAEVFSRLDS